jgi:serine protease Do
VTLFPGFGEVGERLRRATVEVSAGRRGAGSGVIVKADGVIVTNAHVAAAAPLSVQLWDGTRTAADLVARDAQRDLAVLCVAKAGLPAASLANSDQVRAGELVIAVGNPFGFIGAMTTGVVHAIGPLRRLGPRSWIQSAVQLAPGNSGGPLANARGEVVGINTMVAGGVGLAIPSNVVTRLLERGARPDLLGITVQGVCIQLAGKRQSALLITKIAKGSAAENASLMLGDILVGIGSKIPASLDDFEQALLAPADGVIRLHFLRGDRSTIRSVAVRVGQVQPVAA